MASTLSKFNSENGTSVKFSPIHFATDYLRKPEEQKVKVGHDLSNNTTRRAVERKMAILGEMSQRILQYLKIKDITKGGRN